MLSFNLTLVLQMVSFLVFAWLFNRVFFRPIVSHIEMRNRFLVDQQLQADALIKTAQQLREDHARKLEQAQREAQIAVDTAVREAQGRRSEQLASAQAEGRQLVTEARAQYARERDTLVSKLKGQVPDLARAIAGKVLAGSTLDRAGSREGMIS